MALAACARRRLLGDGLRRKSQKQQEKEQGIFSLSARVGGHWGAPSHVCVCAGCCSDTLLWICLPLTFPYAGTTQKLLSGQRTMKGIEIVQTTTQSVQTKTNPDHLSSHPGQKSECYLREDPALLAGVRNASYNQSRWDRRRKNKFTYGTLVSYICQQNVQ